MPCNHLCTDWDAPRGWRERTGARYGDGQIRCNICNKWYATDVHHSLPDYKLHTHTEENGINIPSGDINKRLFCDCCNMRIRARARAGRYSSTPSLPTVITSLQQPTQEKSFVEIKYYLENEIKPQANYQYVILKTLCENDGECDYDLIKDELSYYNQNNPSLNFTDGLVTLTRHKLITINGTTVRLNIDATPSPRNALDIIMICNRYIYRELDWKSKEQYVAVGDIESWQHTIDTPPFQWGIKEEPAPIAQYNTTTVNDLVYYWVTETNSPFTKKGLVGVGVIRRKDENDDLYWPDEILNNTSTIKKKIFLDTLYFADDDSQVLSPIDGLPLQRGINRIANDDNKKKVQEATELEWDLFPEQIVSYYKISPGDGGSDFTNQKRDSITAVRWTDIPDLTGKSENEILDIVRRVRGNTKNWNKFIRIKKGDIIIANAGQSKILGVGTATESFYDGYKYRSGDPFPHTLPVTWNNISPFDIPEQLSWRSTVMQLNENVGKPLSQGQPPAPSPVSMKKFLMLKIKPESEWIEDVGKKYHFDESTPGHDLIKDNCSTIWYHEDDTSIYLWGYGNILDDPEPDPTTPSKLTVELPNFHYFDELYHPSGTNVPIYIEIPKTIYEKIRNSNNWQDENYVNEITEDLFDELTGLPTVEGIQDEELPFPSPQQLDDAIKEIKKILLVDENTITQIVASLLAGKHILLTGAVGTGKTHLATILPEIIWKEFNGYHVDVHTATSDWTTKDVIGGIMPKLNAKKEVTYDIDKGCVTLTVSKNWLNKKAKIRVFSNSNSNLDRSRKKFRGEWLTIDEFNRANIDKSFGQLFTAIEHGNMKVPTTSQDSSGEDLPLPKDYRIIGTLNTSDRHFLNTLSDALKRRFSIIELKPPSYELMNTELYYVAKKSLEKISEEDRKTDLEVDDETKQLVDGKDSEAENYLKVLYRIMLYIREIKPLGMSLLISVFKFMIVNHALGKSWEESLDLAIISHVLPQLETQSYWTLKMIRAVICNDPYSFFKTDKEFQNTNSNYLSEIEHLSNLLKKLGKKPGAVKSRLINEKDLLDEDKNKLNVWNDTPSSPDFIDLEQPNLPKFRDALTNLIYEQTHNYDIVEEDQNLAGNNDPATFL